MAGQLSDGDVFIEFRGKKDVLVGFNIDASGPGTGCSVEWWFVGEPFDAAEVTEAEEKLIIEQCIRAYDDRDVS